MGHLQRFSGDRRRGCVLASIEAGLPPLEQFEPAAFLASFNLSGTSVLFRAKEIIFAQGDRADAVFFIQSGRVKLTVVSAEGKEATIALVRAGEFLGEACVSGKVSHCVNTAEAVSDSVMLRISRGTMADAMRREPRFLEFFLSYIVSRNVRMQEDLIDQLFNSSEKRLARALLLLAGLDNSEATEAQIPRVSQEVLAEMIGTTRSRISFFMNRFRRQGHVAYGNDSSGDLHVRRSLANVILNDRRCEHCSTGSDSCFLNLPPGDGSEKDCL